MKQARLGADPVALRFHLEMQSWQRGEPIVSSMRLVSDHVPIDFWMRSNSFLNCSVCRQHVILVSEKYEPRSLYEVRQARA